MKLAPATFLKERVALYCGDSLKIMPKLPANSIDAVVCDPPYHLQSITKRFAKTGRTDKTRTKSGPHQRTANGFMNKQWDGGDVAFRPQTWKAVLRVMKPGAYLVAFSSTRTFGRMSVAIEDAGFIVHPFIAWMFGQGFPKAHRIIASGLSDLDRETGGWEGYRYGTQSLKPAIEPIFVGQKPFEKGLTGTQNVQKSGVGALNIDGCRVTSEDIAIERADEPSQERRYTKNGGTNFAAKPGPRRSTARPQGKDIRGGNFGGGGEDKRSEIITGGNTLGRWPANVILSDEEEVRALFPDAPGQQYYVGPEHGDRPSRGIYGDFGARPPNEPRGDSGSAARFFATFPITDEDRQWQLGHESNSEHAKNAGECLSLQSEAAVSALRNAVAMSAGRLTLKPQSYRGRDMNVSGQQFDGIETLLTATIQSLEKRYLRGLPHESILAQLNHVRCAAIPKPTGITTITISLLKSGHFVEAATFDIIETSAEAGVPDCAKRFWYGSKAASDDRLGASHPTVKPLNLMQYLVRLVTPPGGTVLDCFAGTGTTAEAVWREGMRAILIEREAEYQADIRRRMKLILSGPDERAREAIKAKLGDKPPDHGPLFGGTELSRWGAG